MTVEVPDVETTPDTDTQDETRHQRQPPYAVILHNDDLNTFEFVVSVLCKVLPCGVQQAWELTMRAHSTGRSIVWSGALEVAELKAEQIRSCGADPVARERGALPLRVTVEPLPQ